MVGWTIFADHAPQQYGTIGEAILTLFVTLTLEQGDPEEPVIEERIIEVRAALDRLEADIKRGHV